MNTLLPEAVISTMVLRIVTSSEAIALSDKLITNEPMDSSTKSGGCLILNTPTTFYQMEKLN